MPKSPSERSPSIFLSFFLIQPSVFPMSIGREKSVVNITHARCVFYSRSARKNARKLLGHLIVGNVALIGPQHGVALVCMCSVYNSLVSKVALIDYKPPPPHLVNHDVRNYWNILTAKIAESHTSLVLSTYHENREALSSYNEQTPAHCLFIMLPDRSTSLPIIFRAVERAERGTLACAKEESCQRVMADTTGNLFLLCAKFWAGKEITYFQVFDIAQFQ
jgi:hypothetical protein